MIKKKINIIVENKLKNNRKYKKQKLRNIKKTKKDKETIKWNQEKLNKKELNT